MGKGKKIALWGGAGVGILGYALAFYAAANTTRDSIIRLVTQNLPQARESLDWFMTYASTTFDNTMVSTANGLDELAAAAVVGIGVAGALTAGYAVNRFYKSERLGSAVDRVKGAQLFSRKKDQAQEAGSYEPGDMIT